MSYTIGIDIGGTNFRIGCVTPQGELFHFEKKSSASLLGEGAVQQLVSEITAYMQRYQLEGCVDAIAIGVPSTVSSDKSFIYSTPNLKGLENMNLGCLLKEKLGLRVFIDRDVNYLLYNDIMQHQLDPEREKTVLGMYLGTGLGNGLYIHGRLYSGKNGVAGELGHVPFWNLKEKCPCGNEGCVELRCSGIWLTKLKEKYFPDIEIREIFTQYKDHEIILEYIDTLAYPMATEITLLDPDYVIMGGGVMIMKDFPIERLIAQIKEHTRHPYPAENVAFVYPQHSQTSGVVGGGLVAYETLRK